MAGVRSSGSQVSLHDAAARSTTFLAPVQLASSETLTFVLVATDTRGLVVAERAAVERSDDEHGGDHGAPGRERRAGGGRGRRSDGGRGRGGNAGRRPAATIRREEVLELWLASDQRRVEVSLTRAPIGAHARPFVATASSW